MMVKREKEPRKGSVKSTKNRESERRRVAVVGTILVWLGVATLLGLVVYMIINVESADQLATMWIVGMIVGVSFTFIGVILSLAARNRY